MRLMPFMLSVQWDMSAIIQAIVEKLQVLQTIETSPKCCGYSSSRGLVTFFHELQILFPLILVYFFIVLDFYFLLKTALVQPIIFFFITSSFGIMLRKAFIPHVKMTSSWILIRLFHVYHLFICFKI